MKIKIFILQFKSYYSETVHVATKTIEIVVCSYQIATFMQSLKEFCLLFTELFTFYRCNLLFVSR